MTKNTGSLGSLRRTVAARVLAATLVLLVVVPFTAPFSTFDVVELITGVAHADGSTAPLANDATVAGLSLADPFVALVQPLVEAEAAPGSNRLQHLRTIVLRV